MPLTLTILSQAFPAERRGMALGAWGAVGGVALASGPLVGGLVIEGLSWQWVFGLNVPVGIALVPLIARRLEESHGPDRTLDLPGLLLAGAGLLALVWALVNGHGQGWASPPIVGALGGGTVLLAAFVAWERRAPAPMVPLSLFRDRAFAAANAASLLTNMGMFGAVFLLTQFFQTAQGLSPLESGLRVLPWTLMPMVVAPVAGALSDRVGGRPLLVAGLALQAAGLAWNAAVTDVHANYAALVGSFVVTGIGMGLFFAPLANVILSSAGRANEGKASGVNSAVREVGGVLGVALLASVFSARGSYATPATFVDGVVTATWVGAAIVAVGALTALLVPARPRETSAGHAPVAAAA